LAPTTTIGQEGPTTTIGATTTTVVDSESGGTTTTVGSASGGPTTTNVDPASGGTSPTPASGLPRTGADQNTMLLLGLGMSLGGLLIVALGRRPKGV
jgi:LPXTG-motif cell wall-anchored protein